MTLKALAYRGHPDRSIRRAMRFNIATVDTDADLVEIAVTDDYENTLDMIINDVLVFSSKVDTRRIDPDKPPASVAGMVRDTIYNTTDVAPSTLNDDVDILNWDVARGRPVMPYSPGMYCCIIDLGYEATLLGRAIIITSDVSIMGLDLEDIEEDLAMSCSGRRAGGIGAIVWRSVYELQLYKEKALLWGLEPFHVMKPNRDTSMGSLTTSGLLCVNGPVAADRSQLQDDFNSIEQMLIHVMVNHPGPISFNGTKIISIQSGTGQLNRKFVAPRIDLQLIKGDDSAMIVVVAPGVALTRPEAEPFMVTASVDVPLTTTESDASAMWKSGELLTEWCKLMIRETGRISIDCFK